VHNERERQRQREREAEGEKIREYEPDSLPAKQARDERRGPLLCAASPPLRESSSLLAGPGRQEGGCMFHLGLTVRAGMSWA